VKNIHFFNADTSYVLRNKRPISRWILNTITSENKKIIDISYVFCSDNYLLKINQEHLNHNTYTDIITFDYSQDSLISSEIYISSERVKENAKAIGQSFKNEMHRVLIHGVLHLCGYKDKTDKQIHMMRAKEDYYLSLRQF